MEPRPCHFVRRERCPACGHEASRTLLALPYGARPVSGFLAGYYRGARGLGDWTRDGVYQVDRCASCELVFQRFVGDDELLTELYEHWLRPSRPPEHDPATMGQLAQPMSSRDGHELFAVSAVLRRPVTDLRVLDYGMGWGLWAQIAHRLGAHSFGHDLAPSRMAYAAERGVVPVTRAAIPELRLDFINTEQVFEHLSDPMEVLELLSRALRPGGVLKVSVPQAPDIDDRLERFTWDPARSAAITAIHPLEHVNCFDQRSLSALAARAGLAPVRIPLRAYFAFARHRSALPKTVGSLGKACARPAYHRFSRSNLYMWFRRTAP